MLLGGKGATYFAAFKLNQDYIAQNLCVKKEVKDNTCQGCCYLKTQLEEKEDTDSSLPKSSSIQGLEEWVLIDKESDQNLVIDWGKDIQSHLFSSKKMLLLNGISRDISAPPEC